MFVLNELEKILRRFAEDSKRSSAQPKISLAAIERVDIEQLRLADKVRMQPFDIQKELIDANNRRHEQLLRCNEEELSTDRLFCSWMKSIVLDHLRGLPARAYPAARLMICDQPSFDLLTKFQFLCQNDSANKSSLIVHGEPYNVVAVLQLEEVVEEIERLGRPFVKFGTDPVTGKQTAQFDYSIIKQVLPYLKISDLVLVLHQIGELKLRTFTTDGRREHQVLQFLTHFARSSMLLELRDIDRQIGQLHLLFDNVTAFLPHNNDTLFDSMKSLEKQAAVLDGDSVGKFNNHLVPPFTHLTLVAYRLVRLALELGWSLESITFRQGDPTGFTKLFSHILDSVLRYDKRGTRSLSDKRRFSPANPIIPVRVLVVDRFFDLQGLLRHSTKYGAFLDQELRASAGNFLAAQRINTIDNLDVQLCFENIDRVLSALLKLSAETSPAAHGPVNAMRDNQAVHKHLVMIKQMYKMMNEGYLLMRKLESSIESITNRLCTLTEQLSEREQGDLLARIKRIDLAYRKLLSVKSAAIKVSDAIRFACSLIDLINMFIQIQPNEQTRAQLIEVKVSLVLGKELLDNLGSLVASRGSDLHNEPSKPSHSSLDTNKICAELAEKLEEFDKVSSKYCSARSVLSLEEIIEQFYKRQLDTTAYQTQKLVAAPLSGLVRANMRNKIIVLLLGSMSYDELYRIKFLETKLAPAEHGKAAKRTPNWNSSTRAQFNDILTIACGFIRPDEFIQSL